MQTSPPECPRQVGVNMPVSSAVHESDRLREENREVDAAGYQGELRSPTHSSTAQTLELGPQSLAVLQRLGNQVQHLANQLAGALADMPPVASHSSPPDRDFLVVESQKDENADLNGERLARLEADVREILRLQQDSLSSAVTEKQYYTCTEVSDRTNYKPYTIRQACNKGRIAAQKGPDGHWRITHDELVEIQNHGLPK